MTYESRYPRWLGSQISRSALRYAAVGGVNTAFGYAVIYGCMYFLTYGSALSNAIGYSAGIVLSFFLNRRFTFASDVGVASAMPRFLAVTLVAYMGNLATVLFLERIVGVNPYLAQLAGVFPYFLIGYLGCRHLVFLDALAREGGNSLR